MHTFHNIGLRYDTYGAPSDKLNLVSLPVPALAQGEILVEMLQTPINPSDLIPITGAYRHHIRLPQIAGYEGVGKVAAYADANALHMLNQRVLPLRGSGTWQKYVICKADTAVLVPDDVSNSIASRAYINPLAALLLLKKSSVKDKVIVITAAGSQCAQLIGIWAQKSGAKNVYGITQSTYHHDQLIKHGITPLLADNINVPAILKHAELVFDAVGGPLADHILHLLPEHAQFYSYGLLSGKPITAYENQVQPIRFHMRDAIQSLSNETWQHNFAELWPLLRQTTLADPMYFSYQNWRHALTAFNQRNRSYKPIICWSD